MTTETEAILLIKVTLGLDSGWSFSQNEFVSEKTTEYDRQYRSSDKGQSLLRLRGRITNPSSVKRV